MINLVCKPVYCCLAWSSSTQKLLNTEQSYFTTAHTSAEHPAPTICCICCNFLIFYVISKPWDNFPGYFSWQPNFAHFIPTIIEKLRSASCNLPTRILVSIILTLLIHSHLSCPFILNHLHGFFHLSS